MCSINIEVDEINEEVENEAINIAIETGEVVVVTVVPEPITPEKEDADDES